MNNKYESKVVDGKLNDQHIDLLDEDKSISGQAYTCVSFISPEKIIEKKELFFFNEFLKKWDFEKEMQKFVQFLNFISYKYTFSIDEIMKDFEEFAKEEKSSLTKSSLQDDYKTFIDNNEEKLTTKFNKLNKFQTSVRGIKIRGSFPTLEEAELRCKILRELDPNHDVYVGPVGMWMPWHPESYKTGRVEYMEEELNQLMYEKNKNDSSAKKAFEEHLKESKQKAIEDNKAKAEKYGTQVTQTLDENNNLVSVNNTNTQINMLEQSEEITVSDIKKELFEGDNVVIGKSDNGQSQLISGPFATKKE